MAWLASDHQGRWSQSDEQRTLICAPSAISTSLPGPEHHEQTFLTSKWVSTQSHLPAHSGPGIPKTLTRQSAAKCIQLGTAQHQVGASMCATPSFLEGHLPCFQQGNETSVREAPHFKHFNPTRSEFRKSPPEGLGRAPDMPAPLLNSTYSRQRKAGARPPRALSKGARGGSGELGQSELGLGWGTAPEENQGGPDHIPHSHIGPHNGPHVRVEIPWGSETKMSQEAPQGARVGKG